MNCQPSPSNGFGVKRMTTRAICNWPVIGLAATLGATIALYALPEIESTYDLTAITPAGHVYVLDHGLSRDDCAARLVGDIAGLACEVRHYHSTN